VKYLSKIGLVLGIFLVQSAAVAQSFIAPEFILKFGGAPDGSTSSADGRFTDIAPGGIATSPDGQFVYVVDSTADVGVNRIEKFDNQGNFLLKWGSTGTGIGQFNYPVGIAVDASGNVYVVDSGDQRVQKFDSSGNFLLQWYGPQGGQILAGRDGYIYTDYGNFSIGKYDTNGVLQMTFGGAELDGVRGLVMDSHGYLYARNGGTTSATIVKYDPSTGAFLGNPISNVNGSYVLAIDSHDRLYLPTSLNLPRTAVIQVFETTGNLLGQYGSFCELATGYGCVTPSGVGAQLGDGQYYFSPKATFISPNGYLYTADLNERVQKFLPKYAPPLSQCTLDALAALGLSASDLPASAITTLENACKDNNEDTIDPNSTVNGGLKFNPGEAVVIGTGSTDDGTIHGDSAGTLFIGAGVQFHGNIQNVGTIYVTGPGASVSGSVTGITTLYYLPGAAPLTVGGSFSVGTIIQL